MNEARPYRVHGGIDPHRGVACLPVTAMRRLPGSGRRPLAYPSHSCHAADARGAPVSARGPRPRRDRSCPPRFGRHARLQAPHGGWARERALRGCGRAQRGHGRLDRPTPRHTLESIDVRLHGTSTRSARVKRATGLPSSTTGVAAPSGASASPGVRAFTAPAGTTTRSADTTFRGAGKGRDRGRRDDRRRATRAQAPGRSLAGTRLHRLSSSPGTLRRGDIVSEVLTHTDIANAPPAHERKETPYASLDCTTETSMGTTRRDSRGPNISW